MKYKEWLTYKTINNSISNQFSNADFWSQFGCKSNNKSLLKVASKLIRIKYNYSSNVYKQCLLINFSLILAEFFNCFKQSSISENSKDGKITTDLLCQTSETEQVALKTIRKLLQSFIHDWASDEQCIAVIYAIQGEKDLLVVLPTGSGKSIVLILATILESKKIFLVVVLLILLLEDWEQQLKSSDIIWYFLM